MATSDQSRGDRERQLDVVVASYYRAADCGHPPDQEEFVAQHPEFEKELREFFADFNNMQDAFPQAQEDVALDDGITVDNRLRTSNETLLPRFFGDYEILEQLGVGGMGVVYKARQKKVGRIVALKMIRSGRLASPQDVQRFQIEVRAHARLSHPGIVAVHEVGSIDGQHFFTMDYVAGGSLSRLHRDEPVSSRRAAKLVRRLAESMQYAHQEGVFHRDLKPANILLGLKGAPRITDFGLAMLHRTEEETHAASMTETGQILGTAGYMAPEQALGKKNSVVDARSDVYSLGAVLYALLTSRAPFVGESVSDTILQVIQSEPVSPRVLNPSVPADLETICLKCLEKDQDGRIQTAQALADELKLFIEGKPIQSRPCSSVERIWRWSRRNPAIMSLAAIIVISLMMGVGASGYFAWRAVLLAEDSTQRIEENRKLKKELDEGIENIRCSEDLLKENREELMTRQLLVDRGLFLSDLEKAKATLRSGRPGQAADVWESVVRISGQLEQLQLSPQELQSLRDQAMASLSVVDLDQTTTWNGELSSATDIALSDDLDRVAFGLPTFGLPATGPPPFGLPAFDRVLVRRMSSEIADRMEIVTAVAANKSYFRFSPEEKWLSSFDYSSRSVRFLNLLDSSLNSEAVTDVSGWRAVDFHPTRPFAIVGQSSGRVLQFDLMLGESVPLIGEGPPILSIRYSPDSQRFAVCRNTGHVEIRNANTATIERQFSVQPGSRTLAWSPDGITLAVGSGSDVQMFDMTAGPGPESSIICRGHEDEIIDVFWHPALHLICSSSQDGTSRVFETDSSRQLLTITGAVKGFHRDGKKLAIRRSKSVEIYDVLPTQAITRLDRRPTQMVAIHPTEQLLAAIQPDGIRLLDPGSGKSLYFLPLSQTASVTFHPTDGGLVTSGASGLWKWPISRSAAANGTTLRIGPPIRMEEQIAMCGHVRVNADGNKFLVADGDHKKVWLVDYNGSRPPVSLPVTGTASVDISPNGLWVAGADDVGEKVVVFNTETGRLETELSMVDGFPYLRFSPDGKWLAANGLTSASLWKVEGWTLEHTIPLNSHGPAALAFSPDSTLIAIGRWGNSSQLHDVKTKQLIGSLESPHHPALYRDMLFTADGRHLICSSDRSGTCMWDIGYLRSRLAEVHLDWSSVPLPQSSLQPVVNGLTIEVDLGQLLPVKQARDQNQPLPDDNSSFAQSR